MSKKITNLEAAKRQEDYDSDWTIICMNAYDYALEHAIGPFRGSESAVEFAVNDSRCQKDWQWTIVPTEFPIAPEVPKDNPSEGTILFEQPEETKT